ncbi:hypothetical protein ANO14919_104820 [Xylariales sp. No.14919]|nr:hypothetical protein F5X98DRAFT_367652 [Xylaria grammica]GAW20969.1 hypothetical protein ANO14919_104820 [Xylariales sp. No.14919]
MALGSDDNPNNGPSQPFAYVLIPILGFGLIVSLITCYRYKRRRHRLALLSAEDPSYVRDLETGRARVERGPNGVTIRPERGRRVRGRSRRLGLGVGSTEEGLNELGEAPPAYTPNAPKPPSEVGAAGVVENVELTTYSQASAAAGTSRSPPSYGDGPPARPGETAIASTSTAAATTRPSEETGIDASANATVTAETDMSRGPPVYNEPPSGAGAGQATEMAIRTASSASNTARPREEPREGDLTGNATAAPITDTTTTTPTTNEPAPPPRALLPRSSD